MKLKSPGSPQAWLFAAGAALLLLTGLLYGIASLLATRGTATVTSSGVPATPAISLAFGLPISILEFAGLAFIILAALVSIFRTILPPKLK